MLYNDLKGLKRSLKAGATYEPYKAKARKNLKKAIKGLIMPSLALKGP